MRGKEARERGGDGTNLVGVLGVGAVELVGRERGMSLKVNVEESHTSHQGHAPGAAPGVLNVPVRTARSSG